MGIKPIYTHLCACCMTKLLVSIQCSDRIQKLRAKGMALLEKCCPHKHEDLSLCPQHPNESQMLRDISGIPDAEEVKNRLVPGAHWLASLVK